MKIFSNKFFIIGNLLLLLIAIPITLFFIKKRQELRSRAVAASKLYFSPATANTSTECQSFNLDIMIDPSTNQVSIVDFYITFDPTKVTVQKISPSDNFKSVVRALSITNGSADMSVSIGADVTKAVSIISKVATITFVPKAAGSFQVSFDSTKTQVFSLGSQDEPTENVLSSTSFATVTIGTAACLAQSATITPTTTPSATISPTATPTATATPTPSSNRLPVCASLSVSPSASGSAPFAVLFTGTGNDPDSTGLITKATFAFGDGQTQDVTAGLNQKNVSVQATHTYLSAGSFITSLTFTDNQNGLSQACIQNITASGPVTITPTPTPTTAPTATPTLVAKPTAAPTIPPPGSFAQTMGMISFVIIAIVGGFLLLAL